MKAGDHRVWFSADPTRLAWVASHAGLLRWPGSVVLSSTQRDASAEMAGVHLGVLWSDSMTESEAPLPPDPLDAALTAAHRDERAAQEAAVRRDQELADRLAQALGKPPPDQN